MSETFDPATIPMVHLYQPHRHHGEARIKGNRLGLAGLKTLIDQALVAGTAQAMNNPSDGECSELIVQMVDADFGSPAWDQHEVEYVCQHGWAEFEKGRVAGKAERDALKAEVAKLRTERREDLDLMAETVPTMAMGEAAIRKVMGERDAIKADLDRERRYGALRRNAWAARKAGKGMEACPIEPCAFVQAMVAGEPMEFGMSDPDKIEAGMVWRAAWEDADDLLGDANGGGSDA